MLKLTSLYRIELHKILSMFFHVAELQITKIMVIIKVNRIVVSLLFLSLTVNASISVYKLSLHDNSFFYVFVRKLNKVKQIIKQ